MTIVIFFKLLKNLDLKSKTKKKKKKIEASHEISPTTIITLIHKKKKSVELSWFFPQIIEYTN